MPLNPKNQRSLKKVEPQPAPVSIATAPTPEPEPEPVAVTASENTDAPKPAKAAVAAIGDSDLNKTSAKASSSIRVDTSKIDALINMVGEVVITQSMLGLVGENFSMDKLDQLKKGLAQLERHTRDLQQSVMNIRMLPISFVFSRFPRLVHDISSKLGKKN
nr:hypothetical protein [Methylocucumis oryzae]